jgi:hypothetical protein
MANPEADPVAIAIAIANYEKYNGADAIGVFLDNHPNIPDAEKLSRHYNDIVLSLFSTVRRTRNSFTCTPEEDNCVEAMAVFDFCKSLGITGSFTQDDKDVLITEAREVLCKCTSALLHKK